MAKEKEQVHSPKEDALPRKYGVACAGNMAAHPGMNESAREYVEINKGGELQPRWNARIINRKHFISLLGLDSIVKQKVCEFSFR